MIWIEEEPKRVKWNKEAHGIRIFKNSWHINPWRKKIYGLWLLSEICSPQRASEIKGLAEESISRISSINNKQDLGSGLICVTERSLTPFYPFGIAVVFWMGCEPGHTCLLWFPGTVCIPRCSLQLLMHSQHQSSPVLPNKHSQRLWQRLSSLCSAHPNPMGSSGETEELVILDTLLWRVMLNPLWH